MKDVVIIPGLKHESLNFDNLINFLAKKHNVYFFKPNYNLKNELIVKELEHFLKHNEIKKADFIVYSYGSIIFRMLYSKRIGIVNKLIQIGPLNKGSKVLEFFNNHFSKLTSFCFGKSYFGFLNNQKEILKLSLPKKVLVIAGTKKFRFHLMYLIVNTFLNMNNSDGLVFLEETRLVQDHKFVEVYEVHDKLINNSNVFLAIDEFL